MDLGQNLRCGLRPPNGRGLGSHLLKPPVSRSPVKVKALKRISDESTSEDKQKPIANLLISQLSAFQDDAIESHEKMILRTPSLQCPNQEFWAL